MAKKYAAVAIKYLILEFTDSSFYEEYEYFCIQAYLYNKIHVIFSYFVYPGRFALFIFFPNSP